jgi:predicted outer membrane repeat protein
LRKFNLKTSGSYDSLDEVAQTIVASRNGRVVRLRDVADVAWGTAEELHLGRFNGKRAIWVTANAKDRVDVFAVRNGGVLPVFSYLVVPAVSSLMVSRRRWIIILIAMFNAGVASLGTLTIRNSFFYFNQGLTGGGLYLAGGLDSSRADLQQVRIESNRAKFNGGGIFADDTTMTITNTTFINNEAGGSGGGLAWPSAPGCACRTRPLSPTSRLRGGLYSARR